MPGFIDRLFGGRAPGGGDVLPESEWVTQLEAIQENEMATVGPYFSQNAQRAGYLVALYADYASGIHRNTLSDRQRDALKLPGLAGLTAYGGEGDTAPLFVDYIDLGLQMLSDRLHVETIDPVLEPGIEPDSDAMKDAKQWVSDFLDANRFDGLQIDVHDAALRDGDAYLICSWDESLQRAKFHLNNAYNSHYGIEPVFDYDVMQPVAFVKILFDSYSVYMRDKYYKVPLTLSESGWRAASIDLVEELAWPTGMMPVVQFSYRKHANKPRGESAILRAIPIQDALNQNVSATLVNSKYNAFRILFAKGWEPDQETIEPGELLWALGELGQDVDLKSLAEGNMGPILDINAQLIQIFGEIMQLPLPTVLGSNPSGEALKQKEIGLLSITRKSQVRFGNAWEDAMRLAWEVENTHAPAGQKPPPIKSFNTVWDPPEMRDDDKLVARWTALYDRLFDKRMLIQGVRPTLGMTDDDIERLITRIEEEAEQRKQDMQAQFGQAGQFASDDAGLQDDEDDEEGEEEDG